MNRAKHAIQILKQHLQNISVHKKTIIIHAVILLLLTVISQASPAHAQQKLEINQQNTEQDNEIPEFILDEVVVTASRKAERAIEAPAHVTIITKDYIEKSGADSLSSLLKGISSVEINDYGPVGSLKAVSIRGSTSAQTLVLINGTRVEQSHSTTDLSQIPLESIERIEIVRGGMSALYGADAIGGVVNIITKKPDEKKTSITIQNTSYIPRRYVKGYGSETQTGGPDLKDVVDGQRISVDFSRNTSGSERKTGFRITGTFERASNEFTFKDTSYEDRKRINADVIKGGLYTDISYLKNTMELNLNSFATYSDKGVPGSLDYPSSDANERDIQGYGGLNIKTGQFIAPWLTLNLKGYYHYNEIKYTDPPSVDSTHKSSTGGIDIQQEILSSPFVIPMYGLNIIYTDLNSTDTGHHNRIFTGGFLQTTLTPVEGFELQPVVRYDHYSDFGGNLNFRFNMKKTINPNSILKVSFARTYRAPTFNDLYWPEDSFARGNPDLKPETGYSGEVGLTITGINKTGNNVLNNSTSNNTFSKNTEEDYSSRILNIFTFVRYVKDVILWQPQSDGKWAPTNYGRALYPGIELDLENSFSNGFNFKLNYTFLPTFALSGGLKLSDNKRLPYQPVHNLNGSLSRNRERLYWRVWANFESLKYNTTANSAYMPSHIIFNGMLKYRFTNNTEVYLKAENLFNESYQIVDGYPMPGLTLKSGIKYSF